MAPIFTWFRFGFGSGSGEDLPPIFLNITGTVTTTLDLQTTDFNYATAGPYTITVSGGPRSVLLKSWGSGGQEGYAGPGAGGGGGYAEGIISLQEGITYQVVIGSGGGTAPTYAPANAPTSFGGGGGSGSPTYNARGGGFSGMFLTSISQGNSILIAGGGGGTYPGSNGSVTGGGGGGTTGQPASTPYNFTVAGGGTQSVGGTAGSAPGGTGSAGGALVGGAGHPVAGGGGGGGYYGGGGGGGSSGQGQQGAGGGGSGYTNPSYITSPELIQASGSTAANDSDPDRGTSGNGGNNSTGSPGRFIIRLI